MIERETIDRIALAVERAGLSEQTLSVLRECFEGIHFTYCMDDDIGVGIGAPEPAAKGAGFNVYLVDGRSHCMRLTADPECATDLMLAQLDTEPDAGHALPA